MVRVTAMNSAFYVVTVFVLFQFLLVVCSNKRLHKGYAEYDVVNQCQIHNDLYYRLGSGYFSAIKLKIPRQLPFSDSMHCNLTIDTIADSLLTTLDLSHLNSEELSSWNCTSFLEITTREMSETKMYVTDLCEGTPASLISIFSGKEILFSFHFNQPKTRVTSDFPIYLTAYTEGCNSSEMNDLFRCEKNDRLCIWRGLRCDRLNNCGDNSDEKDCEYPQSADDDSSVTVGNDDSSVTVGNDDEEVIDVGEQSMWVQHRTTIIGITVPILIICLLLVGLRFYIVYRRPHRIH